MLVDPRGGKSEISHSLRAVSDGGRRNARKAVDKLTTDTCGQFDHTFLRRAGFVENQRFTTNPQSADCANYYCYLMCTACGPLRGRKKEREKVFVRDDQKPPFLTSVRKGGAGGNRQRVLNRAVYRFCFCSRISNFWDKVSRREREVSAPGRGRFRRSAAKASSR